MAKKNAEYYLLQGIVVVSIALILLISYAITDTLKTGKIEETNDLKYVSYEVLTDNVMPVMGEDAPVNKEEKKVNLVRPYADKTVVIGKNYYDYKGDEKTQADSIIYYENTYIQNTGVDYTSKSVFKVNTIADGTVTKISTDDIVGTTIKIDHGNNLISVYQSVKDVKVNEKDHVIKGQEIATSSSNNISSDLGNHLHFELYKDNILVNPETFFNSEGN